VLAVLYPNPFEYKLPCSYCRLIGGWVLFSSIVVWLIEKAMMQFKIWKYIATFIHYRKPIMRWIKEQKVEYDDEVEAS